MSGPEAERDPYWTDDIALGEGRFFRDEPYTIRMRLHQSTGRYFERRELVPLSRPMGERAYVHGKPYILVPDVTLTIALSPQPDPTGAIGEVAGSEWTGMRHEEIGQAQAWFYPTDQLVILWECFPEDRYRTSDDPRQDGTLTVLWEGFEVWLSGRFAEARQLVTTWENVYAKPPWQAFLEARGYQQIAPAAFSKPLTSPSTDRSENAP